MSTLLLVPDHNYEVVVRVWNNSDDAPTANLPVILSRRELRTGMLVTVESKATPPTPGPYCLQARLEWSDDANPDSSRPLIASGPSARPSAMAPAQWLVFQSTVTGIGGQHGRRRRAAASNGRH